MKERLAQFLQSEGLTAVKFAEIMEVQPSSISHLLSGRNKPNFDFISRLLLRFPDLNPDWMINGIGEIYKSKPKQVEQKAREVSQEMVTNVKEEPKSVDEKIITDVNNVNIADFQLGTNDNKAEINDVTGVNGSQTQSAPISNSIPVAAEDKRVTRVILFFDNGSFEEYHNR